MALFTITILHNHTHQQSSPAHTESFTILVTTTTLIITLCCQYEYAGAALSHFNSRPSAFYLFCLASWKSLPLHIFYVSFRTTHTCFQEHFLEEIHVCFFKLIQPICTPCSLKMPANTELNLQIFYLLLYLAPNNIELSSILGCWFEALEFTDQFCTFVSCLMSFRTKLKTHLFQLAQTPKIDIQLL